MTEHQREQAVLPGIRVVLEGPDGTVGASGPGTEPELRRRVGGDGCAAI